VTERDPTAIPEPIAVTVTLTSSRCTGDDYKGNYSFEYGGTHARPTERSAEGQELARQVKQRDRVLALLETSAEPLDAHLLADDLDLHVTTVRFHLNSLIEEGLVRTRQLESTKVGRPRLGYTAVPKPSYTDLVALLAARLGGTAEERERKACEVGRDWAGMLGFAPADTTDAGAFVIDALSRLGFETRSATSAFGNHELTLCTCPLVEIARTNPEVVRGIQRGLIQQILDDNAAALGARYTAAVFPDPRDGNCSIRLALRKSDRDAEAS